MDNKQILEIVQKLSNGLKESNNQHQGDWDDVIKEGEDLADFLASEFDEEEVELLEARLKFSAEEIMLVKHPEEFMAMAQIRLVDAITDSGQFSERLEFSTETSENGDVSIVARLRVG